MTESVILSVLDSNPCQNIKIDNVDFEKEVQILKQEAGKKLTGQLTFDLVYCGHVLEDSLPLSSYGVKSGVTIQVVKKNPTNNLPNKRIMTENEVQQLVASFRTFTSSSGYRTALQRLARPEVLETIIAATPGLSEDPAAIALIQDPELIVHMADPDTVRKVAEKHPSLIEAASYIAAHVHEEQANIDSSQAGTSTGYSYSLEALSDDEDMELNREPHPLARNSSYNAITAAQLAAAIASATNTTFNTNSAGMPTTPSSSGNVITNEMFSNAIQQAFASTPFGGNSNAPQFEAPATEVESLESRYQQQLLQMHELGLTNDSVNVRALQASSGNVQAAIELVFNGVID